MMLNQSIPSPQNLDLPEWFCKDKGRATPDSEIKEKIRLEVYNEVINSGYDLDLWTDEFIDTVTHTYFKYFDRLYREMLTEYVA